MKLHEASIKLNKLSNIPFKEIFSTEELKDIKINKGKTGQLLELALGMELSNRNMDFEDGELKTNKCDKNGKPLETIFITQIKSIIDDLIVQKPFEQTHLYEKIDNILYVPVCKEGNSEDWMFLQSIHIDLKRKELGILKEIWEEDYYNICKQLKISIDSSKDRFIHTANGNHIQIRSKDSKPYHPIYSSIYGREVSNKNHAFYFRKQFINDVRRILKNANI